MEVIVVDSSGSPLVFGCSGGNDDARTSVARARASMAWCRRPGACVLSGRTAPLTFYHRGVRDAVEAPTDCPTSPVRAARELPPPAGGTGRPLPALRLGPARGHQHRHPPVVTGRVLRRQR